MNESQSKREKRLGRKKAPDPNLGLALCLLPEALLKDLLLTPITPALVANKVFADVIKLSWDYSTLMQYDRHTRGEPWEDRGRAVGVCLQTKEFLWLPAVRRSRETETNTFSFRSPRRNRHLKFGLLASRTPKDHVWVMFNKLVYSPLLLEVSKSIAPLKQVMIRPEHSH